MPKPYPVVLLVLLGLFTFGIHRASAQCSDFTFTTTVTNVTCNNASNGSIAITVTGTGAPYQYQLSQAGAGGWSSVSTFTGLVAGSYPVSVKDALGCIQTVYVTVTQPAPISVTYQETDPVCANTNTGTITQSTAISGGTVPYSYAWTFNGAAFSSAANLTGLAPGSYQLVVSDKNGCTASPNIVAGTSTPISVTGFNANIVATGTNVDPTASANAEVDACGSGGFVFYSSTYVDAAGKTGGAGIPSTGAITSTNIPANSYQLAPLTGNNALQLFSSASCQATTTGTFTFAAASQKSYSTIYVLGTSGSGSGIVNYTVNYTDGSTPTTGQLSYFDWATSSTQAAISGLDRITYGTGASFANDDIFGIYEEPITIPPASATKKVQSITFSYNTSETGRVNLMAVTGYPANPGLASVNVGSGSSAPASVAISDNGITSTTYCSGSTLTFTATPTNGGTAPTYQWYYNGTAISGATSSTYSPSPVQTTHSYDVEMTSSLGCATPTTSTSSKLKMTSSSSVTASVSIAASATSVCSGSSVTFTATPTNGGASPTYQWQVNGVNAGAGGATFTTSSLTNGAQVTVIMTSGYSCATPSPVTSNSVTMTVTSNVAPTAAITPSATSVQSGTSVSFTSSVTNGGASPAYQWYVNGNPISGATSSTYATSSIVNGSEFSLDVTSNATCVSSPIVVSNYVDVLVSVPTPTGQLTSGATLTNNNEPPMSGTAFANSTVNIYVDGVSIGATTASASGTWSFTPTSALSNASHALTVTATDANGNTSAASSPYNFSVNTVAPGAPTAQLTGGITLTNNTKPPMSGTAAPSSTVSIYIDGSFVATVTATAGGAWSYTPTTALSNAAHTLYATATDAYGNMSVASSTYNFSVNTVAPGAPTAQLTGGITLTNNNEPPMSGTAAPSSNVSIYIDGAFVTTVTATADGAWSYTPTTALSNSAHTLYATATDAYGNTSVASSTYNFSVNTVAPGAPTAQLTGGITFTNNTEPPMSGTAAPLSTVSIYIDGSFVATVTATAGGTWSYTPTTALSNAAHTLYATATDAYGNTSVASSTYNFSVNTVAPGAPTAQLTGGITLTNNTEPPMSGTAAPLSTVSVYIDGASIGTTTASATGTWTLTPSTALSNGSHILTATATDAYGNTSVPSSGYNFTINTVAPGAPTAQLTGSVTLTNNNEPPMSGTAADNSLVTIYVDGASIGTTTASATGVWSFTPSSALSNASHVLTATATDAYGNTSVPSSAYNFSVNTVAPGAPTAQLTGSVTHTNNPEPPMSGTAADNSLVTIYVDGASIGTTTASATGTWSFTPSTALSNGSHILTATATDAYGNTSVPSSAYDFSVNTVAPGAPTAQLTGSVTLTNNNEPPMSGTAAPLSTVSIYVDGASIGTTTASATGTWSFTPSTALSNGSHILTATATDAYGNVSVPSSGYNFSVNTIAPGAPTAQLTGSVTLTNNNEPPMSGTAADNSTVTVIVDGTSIGTTIASATGTWSYTPTSPISNGSHTLTATATDAYGNTSVPSSAYNFSVNTVAPGAPTAQLTGGVTLTNNNEPPMSGTAADNSTVTVIVDGTAIGTTTASATGTWSYTPTSPISNGSHTLTATATDAYGNTSVPSSAYNFSVNTVAPGAPTAQLTGGVTLTNNNEPPMSGTAADNSTVTVIVDGTQIGTTTASATGAWSYTPTSPISNGSHVLTATATDAYGNVSVPSAGYNFSVNTVAPGAPTAQLTSGSSLTNNNEPPMSGTAADNSTVTVIVDGTAIGTTTADGSGNWSYTPTSPISNGSHVLTATATDAYGNTSVPSSAYNFSVNTIAPGAPTAQLTGSVTLTNNNEPPMSGTAADNSTVIVIVDGTAIGTTTASATGTWSYTPTSPISNGSHVLTATATDAYGNTSVPSSAYNFSVNTVAPGAPAAQLTGSVTLTNNNEPPMSGTAADNSTVTVIVDGTAIGTTTASATGTWSYTPTSPISNGSHVLTATATDAYGNVSVPSSGYNFSVNTVAPGAPTAQLTSGSSLTNNNEPPMSGTAADNSTVTVIVDGTAIGTTTASATGTWSYTPTSPISNGSHVLTATATDAYGNTSVPSSAYNFSVNTIAPGAPTAQLTGSVTLTNNNEPPMSGTAADNSTVTVIVDGTAIGTTTASATGTWSYTPTKAISNGSHVLTATATDAYGNVSVPSAGYNFSVNTVAPGAPTAQLTGSITLTNNNEPPMSGTAADNSTVTVIVDGTAIGTTTADGSGNWSYTPISPISNGSHVLTATATDAYGNVSVPSSGYNFSVNTIAPGAPTAQLTGSITLTNNNEPPMSGTAADNSTVTVIVDGTAIGTTMADGSGNWSYTPSTAISNGAHVLTATATDAYGNVSVPSAGYNFSVNTIAPGAPTAQLTGSITLTNNNEPPMSGTAADNSTVTVIVDGTAIGTTTASATGTWSYTPTTAISNGSHVLTATATDAYGNTSVPSSAYNFSVNTVAPGAPTAQLTGSVTLTNNNEPPMSGTAADNSTVTVIVDGTAIGTTTADGSGTWSYTPTSPISNGSHVLTATATDVYGNTSVPSSAYNFSVNTIAPGAPTAQLTGSVTLTNNNEPPMSGIAADNSTVTVIVDGTAIGTTTASATGTWSYTPTSPISNGSHVLTATATDAYGNTSVPSSAYNFSVNTIAPGAPTAQLTGSVTLTNNNEPPMSGTAADNSTVTVIVDGTAIGTTTASATGTWSYTPTTAISNGSHVLTATATDVYGNVSVPSSGYNFSVNTVAPGAPTAQLTSGSSLTNSNEPPMSGTAQANSTVTVIVDGTAIGTTTADGSGNWSYTPTSPISNGSHVLTATATDAYGNVSAPSAGYNFSVNTVAPGTPTAQLTSGSSLTNNNEPPMSGTAADNSTVTIYVDGTAIGTTTADGSGNWSYTPTSPISNGSHVLTATATDAYGNVSVPSSGYNFSVNTVAPGAPTAQLTGSITLTNNNEPPMSGTAADNSTVTVIVDGTAIGTTTASATGTWSYTPTTAISNGSHVLTATATDAYGNVSVPSAGYNFSVNTVAPGAPTAQLTSGSSLTNNNEPPMSGTAADNSTVTVIVDGTAIGTTTASATGAWSYTPTSPISNGSHTLTATATDAYGNTSVPSSAYNFSVNTIAPGAPTAQLTGSVTLTNNNEPPMSGTAADNSTVTVIVDGTAIGTTTASATGTWSYTPTTAISNGSHVLTATATDAYGNTSVPSSAYNFSVNTVAPGAPTAQLTGSITLTNNNEPPMSGTAADNSTVTVIVDGTAIGTTTADVSGNWSYTPTSPISNGSHVLTATATDAYGNVSVPSSGYNFSVNTIAPSAPTAQLTGSVTLTNNNEPPMSGTAADNSTVTVIVDGTSIGTTTASATGTWSYTPSSPISNGSHVLTATATDAYGNVSVPSSGYNFSVNTVAPGAPTAQLTSGSSLTNNNEPPMSGTAADNSTVTVIVDGTAIGTTTASATGTWSYTPNSPISNGSHVLTATASDAYGNVSVPSSGYNFSVNTVAPGAPTAQLTSGSSLTNNNEPPMSGTAADNSTVTVIVDGTAIGTTTASATGTWSYTPTTAISNGSHVLTATATDAYGNVSVPSAGYNFSVNTMAPGAPTAQLTGSITLTNNNEPPMSGTAADNSTVTVIVDGTAIGTTTASATGTWSYTPTTAISNGSHVLTATATDAYGNTSVPSSAYNFSVNTVAPGAPTAQLTGSVTLTNNNEPPMSGTAQANSTVTVIVDGTATGTTTADGSGNWSYTPTSPISNGSHVLTATATDAYGNVSVPSAGYNFSVNTVAPGAPTAQLTSGSSLTNNNEPPMSGTAADNSTVTVIVDGTTIGTTTASATGTWSYTPTSPISNGSHVLTATATDAYGNVSVPSAGYNFSVNTVAPGAPTAQLTGSIALTNNNEPPMSGTAADNSTVTVIVDGTAIGTTAADGSGNWSYTPSTAISNGAHVLTATATDAYGNVSVPSAGYNFSVNTVAPGAPTAQLTGSVTLTNNNEPPMSGTAQVNSTVTVIVDGTAIGTTTADGSGNWSYTPTSPISNGSHVLTATATDAYGNVSVPSAGYNFSVNTVAPGAPTAQLTGSVTLTNNNEPPMSGTAQVNSTVTVIVDGTAIGTTTASASGTWSYTPTSPISNGSHTLTATATDAYGNTSVPSSAYNFSVNTIAPGAPTAQLTGSVTLTNNNEPPMSGTAAFNSTVTVIVDGTSIGTTTASATGTWSYTPTSPISNGSHVLTATATDAYGNVSVPSAGYNFSVNTVAPGAPTAQLTGSITLTNNNEPPMSGTAQANSTVTVIVDGTAIGTTTADGSGNWSYTPSTAISNGAHVLTATAADAYGNVSVPSAGYNFSVNTVAPGAPTAQLTSGSSLTNNNEPPMSGTAADNSTVTVIVDGTAIGTTTASATGTWSYTPTSPVSNGSHVLTATATDAYGNVSVPSSGYNFSVNTVAPGAPTAQLTGSITLTNNNEPPMSGTAADNSTVTVIVDGTAIGTTTADGSGNWSYTPSTAISNGAHVLTATATDAYGNVSVPSAGYNFSVNTVAPAAPTAQLTGGITQTNSNEPPMSGTAQPNSTVTIYVDGTVIGTTTATASGTWSYTPTSPISNGSHTLTATATDAYGNVSVPSAADNFSVNTTAPAAPTAELTGGITQTNSNEPDMSGTAIPNSTVTIYVDGAAIGTTTATASGTWSYTPTSPISNGSHTLTATATDAYGNVSQPSAAYSFNISTTTGPAAPTIQLNGVSSPTNNNEPPLKGTAQPNSTVTIYVDGIAVGTATADANGNWTYTPTSPIADGTHSITATATDASGNTSPVSQALSVTISTAVPATPSAPVLVGGNNGNINTTTPTVTGTATPGDTVTIYVNGVAVGTTIANSSGTYTYTFNPALGQGTQWVSASATDAAGNSSGQSAATRIVINTTAPTLTLSAQVVHDNNPFPVTFIFSEPITSFDTALISLKNGTLSNLTEFSPGVYTAFITPMADSTVVMSVAQGAGIDSAGNASLASNVLTVKPIVTGIGMVDAVYPIPASSLLNIKFSGVMDPEGEVSLVSMDGKYVLKQQVSFTGQIVTLNVSNLASAAYVLIIKTNHLNYTKVVEIAR